MPLKNDNEIEWEPSPELAATIQPVACQLCNYDLHKCPGCGIPVAHGTIACADCSPAAPPEGTDAP